MKKIYKIKVQEQTFTEGEKVKVDNGSGCGTIVRVRGLDDMVNAMEFARENFDEENLVQESEGNKCEAVFKAREWGNYIKFNEDTAEVRLTWVEEVVLDDDGEEIESHIISGYSVIHSNEYLGVASNGKKLTEKEYDEMAIWEKLELGNVHWIERTEF